MQRVKQICNFLLKLVTELQEKILTLQKHIRPIARKYFTTEAFDWISNTLAWLITGLAVYWIVRLVAKMISNIGTWFLNFLLQRSFKLAELAMYTFFVRVGRSIGWILSTILGIKKKGK